MFLEYRSKSFLVFLLTGMVVFQVSCRADKVKAVELDEHIKEQANIDSVSIIPLDYDTALWIEILPSTEIELDLKYATNDNFTQAVIYD